MVSSFIHTLVHLRNEEKITKIKQLCSHLPFELSLSISLIRHICEVDGAQSENSRKQKANREGME